MEGDAEIAGKRYKHLRFADDVVLLARITSETSMVLQKLYTGGKAVSLGSNASRTKYMQYEKEAPPQICQEGQVVKEVENFQYLGQTVQSRTGSL